MIKEILDKNEKIQWSGKPHGLVYVLGNPIFPVFFAIWAFVFFSIMTRMFFMVNFQQPIKLTSLPIALPILILIIIPLYRFLKWTKVEYVLTNKRVYISQGIIGTDIQSLELYEIEHLSVDVNPLEKLVNRGTIKLTPNISVSRGDTNYTRSGKSLIAIEKPYEVYKMIQNLALDVSTDYKFPNQYRPKENPGYNTEFNRKDEN